MIKVINNKLWIYNVVYAEIILLLYLINLNRNKKLLFLYKKLNLKFIKINYIKVLTYILLLLYSNLFVVIS